MRDESVTITKALGIMLMVLAHSGFSYIGDAAINMFHMPLFFFMSGYCFSNRHLISPKNFIVGKIKTVYFPYLKYSLLFLLLHNVFYKLHIFSDEVYTFHDFISRSVRIAVGMGMHDQLLGGYWFMGNLFWGLILAYALLKLFRNNATIGILISLFISMLMNSFNFHVPIIQVYPSDFFSTAFILTGIQYKRGGFQIEQKPYHILPFAFLLVILGTIYWRGCVPVIDAWKILPYYVTAIAGTLAVFSIAKTIKNKGYNWLVFNKIGGGYFRCFNLAFPLF